MSRSLIILFLFSLFSSSLYAQQRIRGQITGSNGVPLSGAVVRINLSTTGAITNADGRFEMNLKPGKWLVSVEYIGYKSLKDSVDLIDDVQFDRQLVINPLLSKEFVVEATRAGASTPMAFQNIDKEEIEQLNLGQDLPILLNQTLSSVTTSDAGAGIGYTGIRIRGSDATRINVTFNGVPLNDAESHGVFWVNMPDISSSIQNIQIQRGAGTSTNGAAAFGASIQMESSGLDSTAHVEINNSIGSFNTRRHNVIFNSGLLADHFAFEGRMSHISSDGYIDRSASNLRSHYFSGAYHGEKIMVKALTFGGAEVTQQAWWGTPESRVNGDVEEMTMHAARNGYSEEQTRNLLESGRTYNYYQYDNEIDNYKQDHYHLVTGYQLATNWYLNLTGHYTYGRGYFEQFRADRDPAEFGLEPTAVGNDTVQQSDYIVRRWLENHFYGGVYSLQYRKRGLSLVIGGSANRYVGDHFGEIIWAEWASNSPIRDRYYGSTGDKIDASNYVKAEWSVGNWSLFADVQGRFIDYVSAGTDNDLRGIAVDQSFFFFNPKAGLTRRISSTQTMFASISRAAREPVRSDFIDAIPGKSPTPEYLTDVEMGWMWGTARKKITVNGYFMHYQNQLVLTGEVNDVGASVRTNVPESYRAGVEMMAVLTSRTGLFWSPNLSISRNKIKQFEEVIYDYTNGFDIILIEHEDVDIAFSPSLVAGSQLGWNSDFGLKLGLLTKVVGRQFLDNTSNENKRIPAYVVNDVRISYAPSVKWADQLEWTLLVNNVFNTLYSSNGYTYSYVFETMVTENFFYPQAGINWLLGMKVRF